MLSSQRSPVLKERAGGRNIGEPFNLYKLLWWNVLGKLHCNVGGNKTKRLLSPHSRTLKSASPTDKN